MERPSDLQAGGFAALPQVVHTICRVAGMFDRIRVNRKNDYGMTTLELRGVDCELQIKFISRQERKARKAIIRGLLAQMRPWLRYFKEPVISHSNQGRLRERPLGRSILNPFQSQPVDQLTGSVGYAIRMRRIEAGLTQRELARKLKIQRSHLSDIERGIHLPGERNRMAIDKVLQLEPDKNVKPG